jgi:hypothetical protein
VLIALAAATAIFFTTSLLVMDSPISTMGFGPSQFVSRMGRTAALAGVGGGLPAAANNESSPEAEDVVAAPAGKQQGAGDVVKTCESASVNVSPVDR